MQKKSWWVGGIGVFLLVVASIAIVGQLTYHQGQEGDMIPQKEMKTKSEEGVQKNAVQKDMSKTVEPVVTEAMRTLFSQYVSTNYPAWTIESMKYDPMCDGSEAYDVTLSNTKKETFAVILSREGSLLQTETDAPTSTMPAGIQNILKKSYATYSYGDSYERLTMANGEKRFLIDVSNDGDKTTSELILSEDGRTLCQSQPK